MSNPGNTSAGAESRVNGKGKFSGSAAALAGFVRGLPEMHAPVFHYCWHAIALLGACGFRFADATGALAAVTAACGAVLLLFSAAVKTRTLKQAVLPAKLLFGASLVGAAANGLPLLLLLPVALAVPAVELSAGRMPGRNRLGDVLFIAALSGAAMIAQYITPMPPASVQLVTVVAIALWAGLLVRLLATAPSAREPESVNDDIWRVVADGPPVMILVARRSGEIVRMVDPSHEILGIAPFLLTGQAFLERVHLTDRVALLDALDAVCMGGARRELSTRIRMPAADGDAEAGYRAFQLTVAGRGEDGTALVAVRPDDPAPVLEQRVAELEHEQAELDVAKSRFLASASHELRTPLNAIIGFADLLAMQAGDTMPADKQREYAGLISASGQHLLSVVNAILDMSKLETRNYGISPKRFEIAGVIDMSKSMVQRLADERGVAMDVDIDADCVEMLADQRAVQQILINLLSNAVKFTGEGGHVRVSTQRYANWDRIVVTDTGIGMEQAFLEKLGTPFLQADNDYTRRHEGTGLGLSVVKGLVELHGGRMDVESKPFEGTKVTVSFPADGPVVAYGNHAPAAEVLELNETERGYEDGCRKSA